MSTGTGRHLGANVGGRADTSPQGERPVAPGEVTGPSVSNGVLTVRPYCPVSFWTKEGACRIYRRFVTWGIPDLTNWRFITLTINRDEYPHAEKAYELGKLYVSDFRTAFKAVYPHGNHFTKLELHEPDKEDGQVYPHWHLLLDWKRQVDFVAVSKMWRMGRVNVQRIEDADFDYVFKYVAKSVDDLPNWLKGRRVVRAWSASKGFFLNRPHVEQKGVECGAEDEAPSAAGAHYVEVSPGVFARDVPVERDESPTLGERIEKWRRTVQITQVQPDGSVRGYLRVTQFPSWNQFLAHVAQDKLAHYLGSSDLTINEREVTCLSITKLPSQSLLYS